MGALKSAGFATPEMPQGRPVRITNAVKCLPPKNLPKGHEVSRCAPFLRSELASVCPRAGYILALGGVAHRAVLSALQAKASAFPFGHDARHQLPEGPMLISSYHPSRLNVNTGRLSVTEFHRLIASIYQALEPSPL